MKESIENKIKESLNGHEYPYDATAWSSMSARLDAKMPTNSGSSSWKWWIGGAAVVTAIGISAVYLFTDKSEALKSNQEVTQTAEEKQNPKTENKTVNITTSEVHRNEQSKGGKPETVFDQVFESNPETQETSGTTLAEQIIDNGVIDMQRMQSPENLNNQNTAAWSVKIPEIGSVCALQPVYIDNANTVALTIGLNDDQTIVPAGKEVTIFPKYAGVYTVSYVENGNTISSAYFTVKPAPRSDFQVDMTDKYDEGIPTSTLMATSVEEATYTWSINGKHELTGLTAKAHFFSKGNQDVELIVTNSSTGCQASTTKTIRIEDDYNLLATNTFTSTSSDPRKSTFMPYALKVRNVDFKLTIIDPSNGAIVFETSDASDGWNGIDKRNGQLVDVQKPYVWIVRILNPLPGEQQEYKSTVIRLN
ncbi:MAG: hypothetical protein RL632_1153 [Bacteroidota bacterium]|jgi:hypothetical protein